MPARRKSRQRAVQVLFLWDSRKLNVDQAIDSFEESLFTAEVEEETGEEPANANLRDGFMEALVRGTIAHVTELDGYIAKRAENWRLERMPIVDRNILRMAIQEIKYMDTPPPVVIDEALELARRYSDEEAVPFLNGVLDAVRRLLVAEKGEGPEKGE